MTLVLRYAARSDRGLVRANNQDSVYAGPRLLALADGMGGHAAGEVASKVVSPPWPRSTTTSPATTCSTSSAVRCWRATAPSPSWCRTTPTSTGWAPR